MADEHNKVMPRTEIRGGGPLSDPEGIARLEHDAARFERTWRPPPKRDFGEIFEEVHHHHHDEDAQASSEDADADPGEPSPSEEQAEDAPAQAHRSLLPPDPRMAALNAQLDAKRPRSTKPHAAKKRKT